MARKMLIKFESINSRDIFSIATSDETYLYYYDVPTTTQNQFQMFEGDYPITLKKPDQLTKE